MPVWALERPSVDRTGVIPSLTMDRVVFAEPEANLTRQKLRCEDGHGHPIPRRFDRPPPGRSVDARAASTEALGEQIAALAARLHAATYELLVLLREFDDRTGWNGGFASCAHWLHWRTGIDLGAAREKVRVAHALAALPRLSATMQRGAISYAKVRALTRVATPDNEAALLDLRPGRNRRSRRTLRPRLAARRSGGGSGAGRIATSASAALHLGRRRRHGRDPWPPHAGSGCGRPARARGGERPVVPGGSGRRRRPESLADEVTPAQRRADALGLLAEAALKRTGPRVSRRPLPGGAASGRPDDSGSRGRSGCGGSGRSVGDARGRPRRSRRFRGNVRRLSCDASLVPMHHDADGAVLDVGRKTRTVPPSIRRALLARDTTAGSRAVPPGAATRITCEHWLDGGAHEPRQPRAPVPAPPSRRPRRRIRVEAASRRDSATSYAPMGW